MTQPPEFLQEHGRRRAEFWDGPPRGRCTGEDCADPENQIIFEGLCATCYRVRAFARPKSEFSYPCDRCGGDGAFRDPLHRQDEYLCRSCHEANGYIPGERAMISQIETRQGFTHSRGRKDACSAAGRGTECGGQVKPRGKLGVLCDKHNNPKLFR